MTAVEAVRHARITEVWGALGGPEIKRNGRSQAFWRVGADGWSVSLDDDRGCWYDHRDAIGGGVLDLICHVRGGSRREALRWLADWCCIPLDGRTPLSQENRRRFAKAREAAPELARQAGLWYDERCAELDQWKQDALERDDRVLLIDAAKELHALNCLKPQGIVRAYLRAKTQWSEHSQALVAQGETWKRVSEALVTLLIARWQEEEVDLDIWTNEGGAV